MPYERKFVPSHAVVPRAGCPVCGEAVYSPAGIHPQCAMDRSDPLRRAARRGRRGPAPAGAEPATTAIPPDLLGQGGLAPG